MAKIVIFGAQGTLGQQLVKIFKDQKPLALDKEQIDITKAQSIADLLLREKPGLILNAAAFNDVDGCESAERKPLAEAVNSLAPGYLAKAAKEINAKFIHYSTDYVFGGGKIDGYKEDEKPQPINHYGWTKLQGEKAIINQWQKYYLIRTTRLFGPKSSNPEIKRSFIEVMLDLAEKSDTIKVVVDERAKPTYALDLAQQTRYLVEHNYPFGIYHVTNQGSCTWYEFASEIFKIIGLKTNLIPISAKDFPRPAKRPKTSILINTKLPPLRPWQEALTDFLNNYYLKNQIQVSKSK